MTERSVQCPLCPFSFARLADAGDYHAYVCPVCGWSRPTDDRRPGNRPADVCALCDHAIDLSRGVGSDYHLYVGPGMVHGGGAESIPVHHSCACLRDWPEGSPAYVNDSARVLARLVGAS